MNTSIVVRRTYDDYLIKQEAISMLQSHLIDLDYKSKETILLAIAQLERESQEIGKSLLLNVTL